MHRLPFAEQLRRLNQRAANRRIPKNDRYLLVYSELLHSMLALRPLNKRKLMLAAHAVFGWMPTQLRVDMNRYDSALKILKRACKNGTELSVEDVMMLAATFQTANGKSVVAASKILHFLAPKRFPIWDKFVAKAWGAAAHGRNAAHNYLAFTEACRGFAVHRNGQRCCERFRRRLAKMGYSYQMTNMRLIELMFFLRQ